MRTGVRPPWVVDGVDVVDVQVGHPIELEIPARRVARLQIPHDHIRGVMDDEQVWAATNESVAGVGDDLGIVRRGGEAGRAKHAREAALPPALALAVQCSRPLDGDIPAAARLMPSVEVNTRLRKVAGGCVML